MNSNHGAGHCDNTDLEDEIWDFTQAQTYGAPSAHASAIPTSYPDHCAIC